MFLYIQRHATFNSRKNGKWLWMKLYSVCIPFKISSMWLDVSMQRNNAHLLVNYLFYVFVFLSFRFYFVSFHAYSPFPTILHYIQKKIFFFFVKHFLFFVFAPYILNSIQQLKKQHTNSNLKFIGSVSVYRIENRVVYYTYMCDIKINLRK